MRDKPEEDLTSEKSAEVQSENTPLESEEVSTQSGTEESFRIKDQFEKLDDISPIMDRNRFIPSSASTVTTSTPKAPSAEVGQPKPVWTKQSIRRKADFQDFFINLDFIKIMRGVYRRFWVVLLCGVALMLLFLPASRSLQNNTSYSSKSVIIYTKPEQKQIDMRGSSFMLRPLSETTLVDMLLSPAVIQQLEEFTGFHPLDRSISFDTQTKSDVITLMVSDMPDEQTAISTANKLAESIIESTSLYYRDLAAAAYEQYRAQRIPVEKELNAAKQAVEEFQLKNQLLELNTQYQNYFSARNAATERLSIAKVAHEGLSVRIKNYEKMIEGLDEEVLNEAQENNPLKREISNAEAALLQARIQYAADNPKILRQERKIQELNKMVQSGSFNSTRERTYVKNPLKDQLQGELLKLRSEEDVAAKQVIMLTADLEKFSERFKELPGLEKEYAALLEQRAQLDANYKTIVASEDSARMTMTADLTDFRFFSPATTAEMSGPSFLGKIIPLAGFILGFFGGLALVLLFELLDAKIKTQQQLEKAYDAPCLASIVDIPNLAAYDMYNLLLPSLRDISERMNVMLLGKKTKTIGFLSSLDGEGKSVIAFNLARYYSSLNTNVLFVSFDTNSNPCLPDAADIAWPQAGIEDYLTDKTELKEMLSTVNGVDVIRVQNTTSDLHDLVKSSAMSRLWDLLRENYDLIITEIPSVLDHPIVGTISGYQDDLIYVLASPVSDRKIVDAGLEFLEDRGLVPRALIFNRVNPYYLEDIRQQRIIRDLAGYRSPLAGLIARVRKIKDASPRQAPKEPVTPPVGAWGSAEPATAKEPLKPEDFENLKDDDTDEK